MKIKFFGSGNEVGRSCILLNLKNKTFLLDAGIKLGHGVEYPIGPDEKLLKEIDSVFISHAHLDHTGALPHFNMQGLNCPILGTFGTRDLTLLLLKDAYKISLHDKKETYTEDNVRNVMNLFQIKNLKTKYEFEGISYEFFDAGHIPGSASIVFEADHKRILYTGDINTTETRLLNPANTNYGHIDVMICESTYGNKNHEDRVETEKEFISEIKQTTKHGSVLIPAFAVGRAQEIALILGDFEFDVPVFLDGMAHTATDFILKNPSTLKDAEALRRALRRVTPIDNFHDRKEAEKDQAIIITTSGMLNGGPVMEYLRNTLNKRENAILLTGYQAEETNGRLLMMQHKVDLDGLLREVKCKSNQFDFSAHSGMNELQDLIRKVHPKKLILNHGDDLPINALAEFARSIGIEVFTPKNGDEINI